MWRPQRILVGTDFSDTGQAAVDVAMSLARRVGARVDLVHALQDRSRWVTGYSVIDELLVPGEHPAELRARVTKRLEELGKKIGPPEPKLHALSGDPAAEILALRELLGADLLVLGARGLRGLRRFLLGSISDRALRRPGSPLLLVREHPTGGEFKKILVGVEDPSGPSRWLEVALALAHEERADVFVLHVLPPKGYLSDGRRVELYPRNISSELERRVAELDPSVPVQVIVRRGDPVNLLPSVARKLGADLVVLGAERHADGFPGRVTDRVARAGLPALMVVWPEEPEAEGS
jgi:nucleotide-binding universal stress UspA family protein